MLTGIKFWLACIHMQYAQHYSTFNKMHIIRARTVMLWNLRLICFRTVLITRTSNKVLHKSGNFIFVHRSSCSQKTIILTYKLSPQCKIWHSSKIPAMLNAHVCNTWFIIFSVLKCTYVPLFSVNATYTLFKLTAIYI